MIGGEKNDKLFAAKREREPGEVIPVKNVAEAALQQVRYQQEKDKADAKREAEAEEFRKYEGVAAGNTEKAGGTRYSAGKPLACWAPYGGLSFVEEVSVMGADKYAPLDYLNGQSFSTLVSCGFRHSRAMLRAPLSRDKDSGLYHAAHAAWNNLALLDFIAQGRASELDDITIWHGVTASQRREMLKDLGSQAEVVAYLKKQSIGTTP